MLSISVAPAIAASIPGVVAAIAAAPAVTATISAAGPPAVASAIATVTAAAAVLRLFADAADDGHEEASAVAHCLNVGLCKLIDRLQHTTSPHGPITAACRMPPCAGSRNGRHVGNVDSILIVPAAAPLVMWGG